MELNKEEFPATNYAYEVVGRNCGRDKNGVFRCVCGKCKPLRKQSKNRRNSGNDGSDGGNDTNDCCDHKAIPICPLA